MLAIVQRNEYNMKNMVDSQRCKKLRIRERRCRPCNEEKAKNANGFFDCERCRE
jgi:hypothetical protein